MKTEKASKSSFTRNDLNALCFWNGAADGTWTHTLAHTPLKRACLPIPALPHKNNFSRECDNIFFATGYIIAFLNGYVNQIHKKQQN